MLSTSCTNTHYSVSAFEVDGMVLKKLISQEWKKIPPRNYLWLNDYIFQKLSFFVDIIFEKIENYMSKITIIRCTHYLHQF